MRIGVQSRVDDARVALNTSTACVATSRVRADDVRQRSGAIWTSVESRWASRFRSIVGLRSDAYAFDVVSDLAANSGTRTAALASPKGSLVFGPFQGAEFYVGGGLGFHSNDARGSTISVDPVSGEPVSRVDPLVRSRGAEVGVCVATTSAFRSTASLWSLSLDSELLFVGDAGTTEPQGRSRRTGVTVANFWRPDPRLVLSTRMCRSPGGAISRRGTRQCVRPRRTGKCGGGRCHVGATGGRVLFCAPRPPLWRRAVDRRQQRARNTDHAGQHQLRVRHPPSASRGQRAQSAGHHRARHSVLLSVASQASRPAV